MKLQLGYHTRCPVGRGSGGVRANKAHHVQATQDARVPPQQDSVKSKRRQGSTTLWCWCRCHETRKSSKTERTHTALLQQTSPTVKTKHTNTQTHTRTQDHRGPLQKKTTTKGHSFTKTSPRPPPPPPTPATTTREQNDKTTGTSTAVLYYTYLVASLALRDERLPPPDQRPPRLGDVEDVPHVAFVDLLQLLLSESIVRHVPSIDRFIDSSIGPMAHEKKQVAAGGGGRQRQARREGRRARLRRQGVIKTQEKIGVQRG